MVCRKDEYHTCASVHYRKAVYRKHVHRNNFAHGDYGRQVAAEIDRPDHPRDCLLAQLPKRFILWEILQALRGCLAPEIQEQLKEKMRFSEKKHHFLFVSYEKALHLLRN